MLIANKGDYNYINNQGETPVEVSVNAEMRQCILKEIRWYRRRSLILARPHDAHESTDDYQSTSLGKILACSYDAHESTDDYQPTSLGKIIIAIKSNDHSSSHDGVLYQLKMKIASFL